VFESILFQRRNLFLQVGQWSARLFLYQ